MEYNFEQQLEPGVSKVDKTFGDFSGTPLLKQAPQVVLLTDASLTTRVHLSRENQEEKHGHF